MSWATTVRYQALFSEAGGIAPGNKVLVSGVKVGTVSEVSLREGDALVTFQVNGKVRLGSQTTAHIRTGSLLGARVLTLEPAGRGSMHARDVIPVSRTSSPYSLSESVSDLTTDIAGTSTDTLNQSLNALSETLDRIAPELGPTFDGLSRVSKALNSRSGSLGDLLKSATDVTGIISQHSQQVNELILNGNDLLSVLVQRRDDISELLANTSAVARELSGLVADNQSKLAPTLDKLNAVTAVLEKNRDNISARRCLGSRNSKSPRERAFRMAFTTTPTCPIIAIPELVQPFLDYYFGFRRGDPNMPRALFPWPHNGIPGGSR